MITMRKALAAILALLPLTVACDIDETAADNPAETEVVADLEVDAGDSCPDLSADDHMACDVLACSMDAKGRLSCTVAWFLPEGHRGDFAIGTPVDQPWNAWPTNADAGAWEDIEFTGTGATECGQVAVSTETIEANPDGDRVVSFTCEDSTAGLFMSQRVLLTANGPVAVD